MRMRLFTASTLGMLLSLEAHATTANVPEPSLWALLAGGVAAAMIIKRLRGGD